MLINEDSMALTGGFQVWWKFGRATVPGDLAKMLDDNGYERFSPEKRTWSASLKLAISDEIKKLQGSNLVRPLADQEKNGFSVMREIKGQDENQYPVLFHANVSNEKVYCLKVSSDMGDQLALESRLQKGAEFYHNVLTGAATGKVLVNIIRKRFDGTSIQDGGKMYFIPSKHLEEWKLIEKIFVGAAAPPHFNRMYRLGYKIDENSMLAIKDQIESELLLETRRIMDDFKANDMSKRVLENRADKIDGLVKKMELYESILDTSLGSCRDQLADLCEVMANDSAAQDSEEVFGELFAVD